MNVFVYLLQPGQEGTEISVLLRDLENYNNDTRMCARKVKCLICAFYDTKSCMSVYIELYRVVYIV